MQNISEDSMITRSKIAHNNTKNYICHNNFDWKKLSSKNGILIPAKLEIKQSGRDFLELKEGHL